MHVLVAGVVAAALAAGTPPNPIQGENALPGTAPATWLQPARPPTSVEGYASELSILPGEQVHLHVSTEEGRRYRVEVYRLGYYGERGARLLGCLPSCDGDEAGHRYGSPAVSPTGVVSAGWPVTDMWSVPATATTGYYYALLRVTSDGDDNDARGYVPFIVRSAPSHRSPILVQVPVNTWQAYNAWGGKSLYPSQSTEGAPAQRVSFDRPLAYDAQGPFDWEYNMVRFLESQGFDVSYQTDADTDAHPESLLEHRLVMVIGHDEYWTKRMRDAFDAARGAGTNLAFTNSNAAYWQVRYEDGGRTIVGYKDSAPDPEPDPALQTIRFRSLQPPRPECGLLGVMHYRIREHESGPVDYTVTDAAATDPWFAFTEFKPGDVIRDVVSNEWDSLPEEPTAGCSHPDLVRLFHYEGAPQNADAVKFAAPSGARVFAGGAQQLSWSLDTFNLGVHGRTLPPDARLQRFMLNAIRDLTTPAPPAGLTVSVRRRTAIIRVRPHDDPRIQRYEVYRYSGGGAFPSDGRGIVRVCRTTGRACTLRRLRPGTYRFAAIAVDAWSPSVPVLSRKVVIRRSHR